MSASRTTRLALCGLFTALMTVSAYIRIPAPGVPFTLQTSFVLLSGFLLGAEYSSLSMGVYAFMGLLGLPVFTGGGGVSYILNPSFGYILGFVAGGFVCGLVSRIRGRPSFVQYSLAGLLGLTAIYLLGTAYFYLITRFYIGSHIGFTELISVCILIYLPKDILLCTAAVYISINQTKHS